MLIRKKILVEKNIVDTNYFKKIIVFNHNYSLSNDRDIDAHHLFRNSTIFHESHVTVKPVIINIWSKAAIGEYLWYHIFDADTSDDPDDMISFGEKQIRNFVFRYESGAGLTSYSASSNVENLILVVNGRSSEKIMFAKSWLNFVRTLKSLRNIGIVMLGDEKCNNSWLHEFISKNEGFIKFVYLVYDSPDIDEEFFFQWPLGVATYRKFPKFEPDDIDVNKRRKYKCNFIGTVYINSSREHLVKLIHDKFNKTCLTSARRNWVPLETDKSRNGYIDALLDSDLTLNPVGQNTECYRIFESLSLGSVPVVENIMTDGSCYADKSKTISPLRLLKKYAAPILYVSNWIEISDIMKKEISLKHEQIIKRRIEILKWYKGFKATMLENFINVIEKKFFSLSR